MDPSTAAPEWELCKENAAPLQRGRNVVELEKSFSTAATASKMSETCQAENQKMVEHYERLVRPSNKKSDKKADNNSNDDDPLIHWLSYIKYFQDTFPSDTHEQFLLMERCTRDLVSNPQYANDVRFIRVCVTYADKTSSPQDVFKYLHSQKVGSTVALFWVAWAWVSENKGDYAFAEKIFKKGISKNAKPLKMLKQRQKQFQRRMSRHWLNTSTADAINEEGEDESDNKRGALGSLSRDAARYNDRSSSRTQSTRSQRGQQSRSNALSTFSVRSDSSQSSSAVASHGNGNAPSAQGFQVFVEEDNEHDSGYNLDQSLANVGSRKMATDADKKKENTLAASRWDERGGLGSEGATTLPAASSSGIPPSTAVPNIFSAQARSNSSSSSSSSGPPPPFVIHVDEECAAEVKEKEEQEEREREKEARERERDQRTLRQKMDAGIAEKLARDPMRYVKNASKLALDQAKEEKTQKNDRNKEEIKEKSANDAKKEGGVSCGFNKRLLSKDSSGQEQCFEEGRAKLCYYKLTGADTNMNMLAAPVAQHDSMIDEDVEMEQSSIDNDVEMEEEPAVSSNNDQLSSKSPHVRKVLFCPNTSADSRNISFGRNLSNASSTVDENAAVGGPVGKEEETINTKLAMRELSMMFASPVMGLADIAEGGPPQVQQSFMAGGISESFRAADGSVDDSNDGASDSDTASFSAVGAILGPDQNETSFMGVKDSNENQDATRNPTSRTNTSSALRSITDYPNSDQPNDHIEVETEELNAGGGFAIHCDDEVASGDKATISDNDEPPTKEAFEIYQDAESSGVTKSSSTGQGFQIFCEDEDDNSDEATKSKSNQPATPTFDIFCDDKEDNPLSSTKPAPFAIFQDDGRDDDDEEEEGIHVACNANGDNGDTATFSQVGDALDFLNDFGQDAETTSSPPEQRRASSKFRQVSYKSSSPTDDFKRYKLPHHATRVLPGHDVFGDISRIDMDEN